ncbi:MAG TPA: hypothetical protein PLL30_05650 [Candidatus Krumholzibacteria bacterium]|nr:hypothetical protein [Candidatus Krumholzibacteria bacterium]HPD71247.1 hypothetical protein [Candidatus Krumholzibacteria bacterium]HRY39053.1 hypothetical protein [Candidatus Krumholzibacteria bacterium]
MWSPRHVLVSLFLCLLAGSLILGCRAFEPEAVIVNRAPETYIIGSPAETSGAYFHFHVYWYATDADGYVERYVWALTDTSIQDDETDDDEEDQRFNPATNVPTLAIGTYTTRTDSVFDFRINQGSGLSHDMTLHMVAIDDRGDFDRTPARLHFFSNALGNPRIQFYREAIAPGNEFADFDTVGYGIPLFLKWAGTTPNTTAYDPVLLAERDTVPPVDGLLGYKWRLPEHDDCNAAAEDCWQPRAFAEATGDSFSYFGNVTELSFLNDGSGSGVFTQRLNAGVLSLLVNTLDVAGVEVPVTSQTLHIVVNYDPDTRLLRGQVDDYYPDPRTYPYYHVFHGDSAGDYTFAEGDTVPDRAYVVFKAVGWDDRRDVTLATENQLGFQGQFLAGQNIRIDGIYFRFNTTYSATHQTQEWTAELPTHPSTDTLGFLVGPFNYDVVMRAVDEQDTRDGTPDTFSFVGNYPPCVQCVELGSTYLTPTTRYRDPCYDAECLDEVTDLKVYYQFDPRYQQGYLTDPTVLEKSADAFVFVNPNSGAITYETPIDMTGFLTIPAYEYHYIVYLHGKDHPKEYWQYPGGVRGDRRIAAWRYQIDYQEDVGNALVDGGGSDDINLLSGFAYPAENDTIVAQNTLGMFINPRTGIWGVKVKVRAPQYLILIGPDYYWNWIRQPQQLNVPPPPGNTHADTLAWQAYPQVQAALKVWQLSIMQFSPGTVRAIAADQSTALWRKASNCYHYFNGTRVPTPCGRECQDGFYNGAGFVERGNLDLEDYIAYSNDQVPVTKRFTLSLYPNDTAPPYDGPPIAPGQYPPGWILAKSEAVSWR